MLWRQVREPARSAPTGTLDVKGALTIAASLAALTYGALSSASATGNHLQAWGSLLLGILLLAAFIVIENRSKSPMMPLSLFSNRTFTGANLLSFFLYGALGSAMLFISLNLVQIQGYDQLQSGLSFLPFTILVLLFTRLSGFLSDKFGPRIFLVFGPLVVGAGLFILSLQGQTNGPADYWGTFFPGMMVFGTGMAFTVSPLTSTVMGAVRKELSGIASGINNAITRIANVFAYAIFGALAVLFFSTQLLKEIKPIPLSVTETKQVIKEAENLGNAAVPRAITGMKATSVKEAYRTSFIESYQLILRLSAVLALAAALMAFLMVKHGKIQRSAFIGDQKME